MDYNPDELMKYGNDDLDRVVDLMEKMEEYAKVKGVDLTKLLIGLGHFKKIPTESEVRENKNNIAKTLETDFQNIVRSLRGN